MMIDHQEQIITDILTDVHDQLVAAGITAALDLPRWLTLSMPFARDMIHGQAIRRCAWELIERNGALIGPAKIALTHNNAARCDRPWSVEKVIEIPLDSIDGLAARVSGAIVDLILADTPATSNSSAAGANLANLEELCIAADVPGRRRGDGSVAITLDLFGNSNISGGGLSASAILAHDFTGEVLAAIDLLAVETYDNEDCRQAAGLFLLQLAGLVRLVRPALCVINDRPTLQLQSYLDVAPTPADLNRALEALCVAAQRSAREIAVLLHDESIAGRWLALRGWSAEAALSA